MSNIPGGTAEFETLNTRYIVLPAQHVNNALRLPAMWAETIGDVKEAEEIAKELAFKHAKAYTVLYVGSTFKPEYSVKKEAN